MTRSIIQRRLVDVSERIKRQRAALAVVEEQLAFFQEQADDARMRALVSETPLGDVDAREAQRHVDAQAAQRDALLRSIAGLVGEQDSLLDRMAADIAAP
jgi:hypothetical protein